MTDSPAARPAEEETLSEVFRAVAGRLRHRTKNTVEPYGVTPGQARALGTLARHGGLRMSALSELLRMSPRSGTEVVDALEERGLVARSPDPDDRRAVLVALTPEGERLSREVRAAQRREAEAFFGTLSPADREALATLLNRLRPSDPPEPP